jgi:Arc/MetJ-type ribon-helix-helix transcriptional regulator
MSKQITVRLPDDQVDFLDHEVSSGHAPSRATAISRALSREQRRRRAERDLQILLRSDDDPDLAELHQWAARGQDFAGIDE